MELLLERSPPGDWVSTTHAAAAYGMVARKLTRADPAQERAMLMEAVKLFHRAEEERLRGRAQWPTPCVPSTFAALQRAHHLLRRLHCTHCPSQIHLVVTPPQSQCHLTILAANQHSLSMSTVLLAFLAAQAKKLRTGKHDDPVHNYRF
jgi:hypothetical protein